MKYVLTLHYHVFFCYCIIREIKYSRMPVRGTETYSETNQTFAHLIFAKIVNGLTFSTKKFILDV